MNLSNIKRGQVYKNYKELCKALEIEYNSGGAKENTLEDLARFVNFKKEGHKFKITSIRKNPPLLSEKERRTQYLKYYERLMLDLLVQDNHNGIINLSKTSIFKALKIINEEYGNYRFKAPRLSELTNVCEVTIEDWYDSTSNLLQRNLETVLNSLKKQFLVDWYKQKTVCQVIPKQDESKVKVNKTTYANEDDMDDTVYYEVENGMQVHRPATDKERKRILAVEESVAHKLGCRDKRDIVVKRKWSEFENEVTKILFEEMDIIFYYESYKIICNESHIKRHWNEMNKLKMEEKDKNSTTEKLTISIKDKIIENAKTRQEVAREEIMRDVLTDKIVRVDDDYITEYETLNERLIGEKQSRSNKSKLCD